MNYFTPLETVFRENPDYNADDELREAAQLFQRQKLIDSVFRGEESLDTLLDLFEDQGMNPIEYFSSVTANIDFVLSNQVIITGADFLEG